MSRVMLQNSGKFVCESGPAEYASLNANRKMETERNEKENGPDILQFANLHENDLWMVSFSCK